MTPFEREMADIALAQVARDRADAWARSAPGTPYGVTEPQNTAAPTEYQRNHPHEFPELVKP